jgi:GntR family transcriptional repressor for pyruvate dehydrogenase complex
MIMIASSAFGPIRTETATECAMNRLIGLVRTGQLKPGDALPPQRRLTKMLELSQTVVREAIRGLASMGIVEIRHGQGVFVRSVSPQMLVEPEILFFLLESEAFFQAIEVRRILEVESIALAAVRATEEDLATLRECVEKMRVAAADAEPLRFSPEFHMALARASHNEVLASMVQSFIRLIAQAAAPIARAVPESIAEEYPQHFALYQAVAARDSGEARRLMREHVDTAEKHLRATFESLRAEA